MLWWLCLITFLSPVLAERKNRRRRRLGQGQAEQIALKILLEKQLTFDAKAGDSIETALSNTTPEALEMCKDTLISVSGDESIDQEEYLTFLSAISDGEISVTSFNDLSAMHSLLFFAAACSNAEPCEGGMISLGPDEDSQTRLKVFCENVMSFVYTEAAVSFQYSARYNADSLSSTEAAHCLERGTQNFLCDDFGCQVNNLNSFQRKLTKTNNGKNERDLLEEDYLKIFFEDQRDLGVMSMPSGPACPYSVQVKVEDLRPLGKYLSGVCVGFILFRCIY